MLINHKIYVVPISAVQQSDSLYICIYTRMCVCVCVYAFFFIFFSIMVYPEKLAIVPCAMQ